MLICRLTLLKKFEYVLKLVHAALPRTFSFFLLFATVSDIEIEEQITEHHGDDAEIENNILLRN